MRRHSIMPLTFVLLLTCGCADSCGDDTEHNNWDFGEEDIGAADAGPDTSPDASADADSGDDTDVPPVDPSGCTDDDQSFVVAAGPALLQGYWSTGEAIGNCIHQVSWLHFREDAGYEQVHVDGNYCYGEGRGVHVCTGSRRIDETAGSLAEVCQLESQPPGEQVVVRTEVGGTYAVHKEAGSAARLTRMAFWRSAENGELRREWVRNYSDERQFEDGSIYHTRIEARLAIEESVLTGAADGVEQTTVALELDVSPTHEDANGDMTMGAQSLTREFEATVEPLEGGLRRLTVDLGYPDSYASERWHNYLVNEPEYQQASDLAKSALIDAFHPVIYFDAADLRVGAGHPQRQSWRAICDPCESYAESFPEAMAEMCD